MAVGCRNDFFSMSWLWIGDVAECGRDTGRAGKLHGFNLYIKCAHWILGNSMNFDDIHPLSVKVITLPGCVSKSGGLCASIFSVKFGLFRNKSPHCRETIVRDTCPANLLRLFRDPEDKA